MAQEPDYMAIDRGSDVLMVSFGGRYEGFNFVNLAERLGFDGLFFRDGRLDWYTAGVCGISGGVDEACGFIRDVIGRKSRRRVLCIGQSSGGYAALRFGLEILPDAIVAFSPQTKPMPDWHTDALSLDGVEVSRPDERIDDLGRLYRARQPSFRVQVHLCDNEASNPPDAYFWDDWFHVGGLSGVTAVEVVTHPCSYHPVAYHLSGTGEIDRIVSGIVG